MIREITRQQIEQKTAQGERVILVEAETGERYYENRHLPDAVPLSPTETGLLARQYFPDLGAEIVIYGQDESSKEVDEVAEQLSQLGYANLYVYRAGKSDWFGAGEYSRSVHQAPQPGMHTRFAGDAIDIDNNDDERSAQAFDASSAAE